MRKGRRKERRREEGGRKEGGRERAGDGRKREGEEVAVRWGRGGGRKNCYRREYSEIGGGKV